MSQYDSTQFKSFANDNLDNLLFDDFWSMDIFNERDMHSSAYFYIRQYFRKQGRDTVYVRCEPQLNAMRPDIVVYERGKPIYVLEVKFYSKPDYVNKGAVNRDLDKLAACIDSYDCIKWGFFYMLYDADVPFSRSRWRLRRAGYPKMSVKSINARRQENNGRRRVGYDDWREEFDELQRLRREYARKER